ncbi:MAG: endo-1,4-beta-xylanase [Verrucomicrobiota bacterium]
MSTSRYSNILSLAAGLTWFPLCAFSAALDFDFAFSPGMVIQRDAAITVTGQGSAGENIKVSFGSQQRPAKVEQDGSWKVKFSAMETGGPYSLEVSDGREAKSVSDVLVGDVWIFSGQSNMQMGLDEAIGGSEAIATASRDPKIRLLAIPKAGADVPQSDVGAKWRTCTPESLKKFSAVAGFFAVHLHRDPVLANVPLGIIDSSFGGTSIEAWTPKGTLPDMQQDQISPSMFGIPPGNLFNRMIAPLLVLPVKGVAWYQGEGNAGQPGVYSALLQNLIAQWRKQWHAPELPFLIVQLPSFEGKMGGLDFSWLREAQARACKESPKTWLAVTYDTTNGADLHPLEKEEIGRRLSLLAAKEVYGRDVAAHGPVVSSVATEGDRLIVSFGEPLEISKSREVAGLALAGADGDYRFAKGRLDGKNLSLTAEGVSQPKTVRYAWSGQTDANLVNAAGLPVAPFRTDTLPPRTLAFQPLPTVYRIEGHSYQLETGSTGNIASLVVGGKQFLSAEPDGGTGIPVFLGRKNLASMRALGPNRIAFSDSNTRFEIACADDSMEWMIRNDSKDAIEFHIALAPQVRVNDLGTSAELSRAETELRIEGINHVTPDGKIVTKIQPHQSGIIRLTVGAATETLRKAAGKRLLLGCAVAAVDLQDPKLTSLITEQFNCLTPEYDLMPEKLVADGWKFTFEQGDKVVAFAEKNQMPVFGHMLVWHFVSRKWLFESADGKPLGREEALANLKRYIGEVMGHYRGRIKAWDVVNEAISDKDGEYLKDTPALRAIGEDYVQKAFEFARAADPDVELYYNDYNIEDPAKLERTLRLVRSLKSNGVRIDAVGIQGHWLLDWPPTERVGQAIEALAKEGVKVMITELDVDPLPRDASGADMAVAEKGANPYPDGLPPEVQEKLAKRYGEIVSVIVRHPEVTMIGFWGTHDGRSWLNDFPVKGRTNHPLLYDRKLQPKPAFDAVLRALKIAR